MRLAIALALTAALHAAGDWPRFRGPNGSGVSDATGLPLHFGPQQNVLWKTPVPKGDSSPVLAGKRLDLTAFEGEKLLTLCVDRDSPAIAGGRLYVRTATALYCFGGSS